MKHTEAAAGRTHGLLSGHELGQRLLIGKGADAFHQIAVGIATAGYQRAEPRQRAAVEHRLRLLRLLCADVAHRPQRRRLHGRRRVAEQLNQPRHNAHVDHSLNLVVVRAGGQVTLCRPRSYCPPARL